ncbi:DUF1173 domain-containing protein [Azohydromonas australica]|uniref:DUF1173 domain-containing protein n=1 Tax=Azohydromonas australica TaxID=364039 RepID=UPI0005BD5F05|nr:DUF1173 domain-containing protein [Azohydromonas australica]
MSVCFLMGGSPIQPGDAGFEDAISAAYAAKQRPLCLCQDPGIPMYIAAMDRHHIVKRMPNTGSQHSPDCTSFEPPAELSGFGEVAGAAIIEDTDTGAVALKLDFSLSKTVGRSAPMLAGRESHTVRTEGAKLTLRALLHYLWEEAGLNSWSPAMEGKRSWYVVRRELLAAAATKSVKGHSLGDKLFVPEPFSLEHKQEIERRRTEALAQLYAVGRRQELMLLIGEAKSVNPARYGFKVVVKHLPDMAFNLDDQTAHRMAKRFGDELALWNADESTHLMMAATFGVGPAGMMAVNEMSCMLTSAAWLPIDGLHDQQLVCCLVREGRRFRRCLRYNLAADRPVAVAVATDTRPRPVAMYVVTPGVEDDYLTALREMAQHSEFPAWFWHAGCEPCPALPAINGFEAVNHPAMKGEA